jgi:membrane-bound ClpP family serine protease
MGRLTGSHKIFLRYVLLQLPEWGLVAIAVLALRDWGWLAGWLGWVILVAWVVKDLLVLPLMWRAYGTDRDDDPLSMVGRVGVARERLAPSGYILVGGERWRAQVVDGTTVERGQQVSVTKRRGLLLYVKAAEPSNEGTA